MRTTMLPLCLSAIPDALKERRQWVTWRYENRGGQPTKVPYSPRTGGRASPTNPATWGTYTRAVSVCEPLGMDGIGFVFSPDDPYAGIDLDHCRDRTTRKAERWALDIIKQLASYTELSPSGTGVHILVRATLTGPHHRKAGVELYDRARFFTMTGRRVRGTPATIEDRQREVDALIMQIWSEEVHETGHAQPLCDASDDEIVGRVLCREKALKLWYGDTRGYASHSEGDLALASILAYYTADPEQIDRLFRMSGLYRDKWERDDYRERTIQKALATQRKEAPVVIPKSQASIGVQPHENPLVIPQASMIGLAAEFADLYSEFLEPPRSFFYFAFLTYLGSVLAKKVTIASELRPEPRLYTVLVGASADDRKTTALMKANEFFKSIYPDLAVMYGAGSAEGVALELRDHNTLLLHYDELKSFVDKAKIDGSVLLPLVTSLFEQGIHQNRTKTSQIRVEGASLSIVAACTTDTFSTMFNQTFHAIGFINRLWVVSDHATKRIALPKVVPIHRVEALQIKVKKVIGDILGRASGGDPLTLCLDPRAESLFVEWYNSRPRSIFTKRLDTYGHRLMILLAVSSGKATVDAEVARAVVDLLDWQFRVRRDNDPIDADNMIAGLEEKIRRVLAEGPTTASTLKRKSNYSRFGLWAFETAIKNMEAAREITFDKASAKYRLDEE